MGRGLKKCAYDCSALRRGSEVKMRGEWLEYWLSEQELIVYYCHVLLYCSCLQGSGNESVFVHRFKIYECVSWQIQNKSTVVCSVFFWLIKRIYHQLLSAACRISGNPIPLYCSLSNVNRFHFFSSTGPLVIRLIRETGTCTS